MPESLLDLLDSLLLESDFKMWIFSTMVVIEADVYSATISWLDGNNLDVNIVMKED